MDENRLRRIANDVSALNVLALSRVRAEINRDPVAASERYGVSLITAQRIGRLPHAALARFGDFSIPLMYADMHDMDRLFADAERSIGQPPGLCATFEGGSDPALARVYLQTVREDAWRYETVAAIRWSWPLRHISRLVELPVTGLLFMAEALRLTVSDGKMIRAYLTAIEAAPLEPVDWETRLGALTTLGELPLSLVS